MVTPSRLLRVQLAAELSGLLVLRRVAAAPTDLPAPRVVEVTRRRSTSESWSELETADVVVGTPNVLSPSYAEVTAPPEDLFDLVIFDEAHHTPATTYSEVLKAFPAAAVVLFTATPFRRDRHPLPGVPAYTYGLAQALEEGVLAPVTFIPVDAGSENQADRDLALATRAAERMHSPEHQRAGSRILARTASVDHATQLIDVYRAAGLEMALVTASTTARGLRRALDSVRDGFHAGFMSVGVLGEGFDFPALKIGVYHQRHASLPATLQFLGRLSRPLPLEVPAELLAVRQEVDDETRDLYSSDVAWASLVPALADAAAAGESERRNYVRSFDPAPKDPLSLAAIRPRKDVQVFELSDSAGLDLAGDIAHIAGAPVMYHGTDAAQELAVIVTEHLDRPAWLDADTLDRYRYELHVAYYDKQYQLLFVHGTRDATIRQLLAAFGYADPIQVDPAWLDRLLTSVAIADYHSVGMRSARAAGGRLAAYRMMAGAGVNNAVLPSETRSYGTGHAIARVRNPMTATSATVGGTAAVAAGITSLGVSYGRAKVFSPDLAQLLDFKRWCHRLGELASMHGSVAPSGPPGLAILSPRKISAFPDDPYLVLVDPSLIGRGLTLVDPVTGVLAALEETQFSANREAPHLLELRAQMPSGPTWLASQSTSGDIGTEQDWEVQDPSGDVTLLSELLADTPITVFYPSGSSTMGHVLFQPRSTYPPIPAAMVEDWPYSKCDITAEHKDAAPGFKTVKESTPDTLGASHHFVVDDDRAGEVADLVTIDNSNPSLPTISLLHLKASSKAQPGARVDDLYEVLGQACRSVVWLDTARLAKRLLARLETGSVVRRGDPVDVTKLLRLWVETPVAAKWIISVVQPGLSAAAVNSGTNIHIMLNDLLEWVVQHDATPLVHPHSV